MRTLIRSFAIAGVASGCVAFASTAPAAPISSPVCLAPMDSTRPNPQPRDVHYTVSVDTAKNTAKVMASACIVSDLDGINDSNVQFSVFAENGEFLNVDGQAVGPLSSTDGSGSGHPKIVATTATEIAIPMSSVGHLLATALVTVHWWECQKTRNNICAQGPAHTDTFLRDVVLQGPSAAGRLRHVRDR
jgi:hypothetical protein